MQDFLGDLTFKARFIIKKVFDEILFYLKVAQKTSKLYDMNTSFNFFNLNNIVGVPNDHYNIQLEQFNIGTFR